MLDDQAVEPLNPAFSELYASERRPSLTPLLLLAWLLQAFYGIRWERLLLEQLDCNLLFRWFVGVRPDDPIWHPPTFTLGSAAGRSWRSHVYCERLLNEQGMGRFLEKLMAAPEAIPLLSNEPFSVDGTLLQV